MSAIVKRINAIVVNLAMTLPGNFFQGIKLISLTLEAVNEALAQVVETEEPCSGWTQKTSFLWWITFSIYSFHILFGL